MQNFWILVPTRGRLIEGRRPRIARDGVPVDPGMASPYSSGWRPRISRDGVPSNTYMGLLNKILFLIVLRENSETRNAAFST